MQIEVSGVLSALEQALGFDTCLGSDGHERQTDHVHFSGRLRGEEIGDCQATAFTLAREGEAQLLGKGGVPACAARTPFLRRRCFIHDHVVAIGPGREVSIDDGRGKQV
jgi:hypothetical protein